MTSRRPGISGKRYGTPTGEPVPQAIDPASGFKVPLSELARQWDNQLIFKPFLDRRNPQDFVRGIKDNMALPYARPEPPDTFVAGNIIWQTPSEVPLNLLEQDGDFIALQSNAPILTQDTIPVPQGPQILMTTQTGNALLEQGEMAVL